MRQPLSCVATSELSHCTTLTYIHFNDDAVAKG